MKEFVGENVGWSYETGRIVGYKALNMGLAIRQKIHSLPRHVLGDEDDAILKPGSKAKRADAEGEKVGIEHLKGISHFIGKNIRLVVDPIKQTTYDIGNYGSSEVIWGYFDAIDGTMKVAGLGSDPKNKTYRLGNNGCWATGIAFTPPTKKDLSELTIGDFDVATIVDGNPTVSRAYPTNAVAYRSFSHELFTEEINEDECSISLRTSTQTNLGQATVVLDNFQAFDRKSAASGSEKLAGEVYKRLANRNEGGAFDIVRLYANMGELLRQTLDQGILEQGAPPGYIEPQGVGHITINENMPNLIPITPVAEGAGGIVIDFDGNPIRERKINAGRPNVIIAANETIKEQLLRIVHEARDSAK
ncbi:MAG: hypothetical protein V1887_00800 [Candidatus Aenigmatarchaeota archaeon]